MSDADIKANIGVSTDVEQATKKTSSAVVSMSKQVEDVGKKFSTGFKDIFLGFFAPMALFQTAVSFISDKIRESKQAAEDGFKLIAKGETEFASADQKRKASYVEFRLAQEKERAEVEAGKSKIYTNFLKTKEGEAIYNEFAGKAMVTAAKAGATLLHVPAELLANTPEVQKAIEEWFKSSPEYKQFAGPKTNKDFKGPDGFSNVIGVGANPVLEMVTRQTQIQEEILEHLKSQAPQAGRLDLPDFTKQAPLTLMKTGNV